MFVTCAGLGVDAGMGVGWLVFVGVAVAIAVVGIGSLVLVGVAVLVGFGVFVGEEVGVSVKLGTGVFVATAAIEIVAVCVACVGEAVMEFVYSALLNPADTKPSSAAASEGVVGITTSAAPEAF